MEAIFVRYERKFIRITFEELLYLESSGSYVKVVTTRKTYLVLSTMHQIERLLPPNRFTRVHRGYVVSLTAIVSFDRAKVTLQWADGTCTLPIGPYRYRNVLSAKLLIVGEPPIRNVPAEWLFDSVDNKEN